MRAKTSSRGYCLFLSVIAIAAIFFSIPADRSQKDVARIDQEVPVTEIPSPSLDITPENLNTEVYSNFNPEYRLVKYERIATFPVGYTIDTINGIVDEMRPVYGFYNMTDTFLMKNGTILVFNTSMNEPVMPPYPGASAKVFTDGANYTFAFKQDIGIASCTIEEYIGFDLGMFVVYQNATTGELFVANYFYNETYQKFDRLYNVTIHDPVNVTSTDVVVKDVDANSAGNLLAICGYYDNGTNDVPFVYNTNFDLSTVVDCLQLNTSSAFLANFDDVVLRLLDPVISSGGFVLTNKKAIQFDCPPFAYQIYNTIPLEDPIDYRNFLVDATKMSAYPMDIGLIDSYIRHAFSYVEYTITTFEFRGHSVSALLNGSSSFLAPVYHSVDLLSMEIAMIDLDNVFTAITDIGRGLLISENDVNLGESYNRHTISTAQTMTFFDYFIPLDIHQFNKALFGSGSIVRVAFASSQSIWVAQFSDASIEMFKIGSSRIDSVTVESAYITHDAGTKYFRYKISGTIERNVTNSNEVVEIGVSPLYIGSRVITGGASPFITSKGVITMLNSLTSNTITGFKTVQVQNFIGFGNKFIDFTVEFDSAFLANVTTIGSYSFVDVEVALVIYEKYANGSYTQKYMSDFDGSIGFFITTYDFDLQTTIILEDSHLLDEIHVFVGGQEYDPYNVVFDLPYMPVLVTDKYTLAVLYNSSNVRFADPVFLAIPTKYEFYISYFSNLDKFGFSSDLVSTFINKTEVTTEFVRILSPNAEIVVKDFADSVLKNVTINRFLNGTYIKIGLDIAQVIISNQYTNTTIDFYLTKDSTTIYYQLPSSTSFILRLALGEYHYKIKNSITGEVLFDDNVTIEAAITLSFGFFDVVIPEAPPTGYTFLDTIISSAIFAGVVFIVMLAYNMGYFKKIQSSFITVKKRP